MRAWYQIFDTLGIDPQAVATEASLTRRDLYRIGGLGKLYYPVPKLVLPVSFEDDWEADLDPSSESDKPKPLLLPKAQDVTPDEIKALNAALFDKLMEQDPTKVKEATDAVNDWTRKKLREDSFYRKIMPPLKIENDELDKSTPMSGITKETLLEAIKLMPQTQADVPKTYSFGLQEFGMVGADTEGALADARARTRGASNQDERQVAAAFWTQFRRSRRKST